MKKIILQLTAALLVMSTSTKAQTIGDYRSIGNTTLTTISNWEYYNGATWVIATQSPANDITVNEITIRHTVNFGTTQPTNRPSKVTIANGWLRGGFNTSTEMLIKNTGVIEVLSNGVLDITNHFALPTSNTPNLIVRNQGKVILNDGFNGTNININNTSTFWDGLENFEPTSILYIAEWQSNTPLCDYEKISPNSNGYLFGNIEYNETGFYRISGHSFVNVPNQNLTINFCNNINFPVQNTVSLNVSFFNSIYSDTKSYLLKISGNLTSPQFVAANATNSSQYNVEVLGNVICDGFGNDFSGGYSGKLILSGATNTSIIKYSATQPNCVIENLHIAKSQGVIVNCFNDVEISVFLELENGIINANANTLFAWDFSYTDGAIWGKFKQVLRNNLIFPMGQTGAISSKRILKFEKTANPASVHYITAEFIATIMGNNGLPIASTNSGGFNNTINVSNNNGYWQLNPSVQSGTVNTSGITYNIQLETNEANINGITNPNNITLLKRGNSVSPWEAAGTHNFSNVTNGIYITKRSGYTSFSDFGFGGNLTVTPLYITQFTGNTNNNINQIKAQVTNIVNVHAIQLERSNNANTFYVIHTWSNIFEGNYQYNDAITTDVYYRLKIINNDGTIQYSTIIKLNSSIRVKAYYSSNTKNLVCNTPTNWLIYSTNGSLIMQSNNIQIVNTSNLPNGVYIAKLSNGNAFKFIK